VHIQKQRRRSLKSRSLQSVAWVRCGRRCSSLESDLAIGARGQRMALFSKIFATHDSLLRVLSHLIFLDCEAALLVLFTQQLAGRAVDKMELGASLTDYGFMSNAR